MTTPGQSLFKILDAFKRALLQDRAIPGSAIGGQIGAGPTGPLPPGGNTGSGYTPGAHTHPLAELEQSGANTGDVPAWSGTEWEPVDLSTLYQPLDSDLTDIAALTTSPYGRSFLELANAVAARAYIGAGQGTVTSVGLSLPTSIFDVSGSPVATSGTLTATLDNQAANTVFKGPDTGSPAAPTFAPLVVADMPADVVRRASAFTAGYIPFASDGNTLTHEAGFEYIAADNELRLQQWRAPEISTPSTPASGFGTWFMSSVGVPSGIDDAGNIYQMRRTIGARVRRTTAQSLGTSGTPAAISFDAERYDYGNCWVVGSPTRLTAPVAGRYEIGANAAFAANGTGQRAVDIRLNGTTVISSGLQNAASGIITTVGPPTTIYELAANDYVEMICFQNSGGALNVNSTGNYTPEFWIEYLGP